MIAFPSQPLPKTSKGRADAARCASLPRDPPPRVRALGGHPRRCRRHSAGNDSWRGCGCSRPARSRSGSAGFWALADGGTWGASFTSELTPHFGVDGLTGLFLGTLGLIAFPALVFASAYLQPTGPGRTTGLLTAAFVLALAGVLCARDPLTFLVFWELMTLVPAAIILVGSSDRKGPPLGLRLHRDHPARQRRCLDLAASARA